MRDKKKPERGQYPSGVYGALDYGAALERYINWLEKDHQRLRDTNYSLLKQLGDKDVEIKELKDILGIKELSGDYPDIGLWLEIAKRIKNEKQDS